ncbi:MAG: DinB family protein [Actinomycetota bacterium]
MVDRTPDDNDETWDASAVGRDELGPQLRANAAAWRSLLKRGDLVTQRPPTAAAGSTAWSALERGCQVRDVHAHMAKQLKTALSKKNPTLSDWDRDKAAAKGKYGEQDPAKVAYDLARNAGKVADMVDRVNGDQWDRSGLRSTGRGFTVESLVRELLAAVVHQAQAAEEGYRALTVDDDADDDAEDGAGEGGDGGAAGA